MSKEVKLSSPINSQGGWADFIGKMGKSSQTMAKFPLAIFPLNPKPKEEKKKKSEAKEISLEGGRTWWSSRLGGQNFGTHLAKEGPVVEGVKEKEKSWSQASQLFNRLR